MQENTLSLSIQVQVARKIDLILGVKNLKISLFTPQQECTLLLGSYIVVNGGFEPGWVSFAKTWSNSRYFYLLSSY